MPNFSSETDYTEFLKMVENIGNIMSYNNGVRSYYYIHKHLKEHLEGASIKSYQDFLEKCGNIPYINNYHVLYKKLYPDNTNAKGGKRTRRQRKSRKSRRRAH